VNSSGTLTSTTSYDAWGNPQAAGGLTAYTPFGYAGGYTDADGLVYLLARYYAPATGQFLSVDPDVGQTLQPYTYASGNPVSNTDPTGDLSLPKGYHFKTGDAWVGLYFNWQRTLNMASGNRNLIAGVTLVICAAANFLLDPGVSEAVCDWLGDHINSAVTAAAKIIKQQGGAINYRKRKNRTCLVGVVGSYTIEGVPTGVPYAHWDTYKGGKTKFPRRGATTATDPLRP
jgi:RHS repeat-associated protein